MILIDNVLCSIHRDIINQGFTNMVTLPDSDDFDCVTCTCIADVDWDGRNEIILGTYGQVHFQCIVISCVEAFTQGEGNLSIFCLLRLRRGGGGGWGLIKLIIFLQCDSPVFLSGTSCVQVHFPGWHCGTF